MYHQTNFAFKKDLKERVLTKYIILHHSEVLSGHTVYDIHRWHQDKGWAGIGYHYFIDKKGDIYEGRPHHTEGAHARGYNTESIGICFEGDFNKDTMGERQLNAAAILIALLKLVYYVYCPELKMCRDLNQKADDPGRKFPFEKLNKKVGECEGYLKSLFGEPIEIADDRSTLGNFEYETLLNLLDEVE